MCISNPLKNGSPGVFVGASQGACWRHAATQVTQHPLLVFCWWSHHGRSEVVGRKSLPSACITPSLAHSTLSTEASICEKEVQGK